MPNIYHKDTQFKHKKPMKSVKLALLAATFVVCW